MISTIPKKFRAIHPDGWMTPPFSIWKIDLHEDRTAWKIIQFIGWDRLDNEIYEGYILGNIDGSNCFSNAVVEWDDGLYGFYLKPINETKWIEDWEINDMVRFEVIGNVFENPELLKGD